MRQVAFSALETLAPMRDQPTSAAAAAAAAAPAPAPAPAKAAAIPLSGALLSADDLSAAFADVQHFDFAPGAAPAPAAALLSPAEYESP